MDFHLTTRIGELGGMVPSNQELGFCFLDRVAGAKLSVGTQYQVAVRLSSGGHSEFLLKI
jgi:hypothetical protein